MRIRLYSRAIQEYESLAPGLRKAADKQFTLLLEDMRHPSLHAKKYDAATNLWQARVNRSWRFYFFIRGDCYDVIAITAHPK